MSERGDADCAFTRRERNGIKRQTSIGVNYLLGPLIFPPISLPFLNTLQRNVLADGLLQTSLLFIIEKYCKLAAFVESIIAAHIKPNIPPNIDDISSAKKPLQEFFIFHIKSATISTGKNTIVAIF